MQVFDEANVLVGVAPVQSLTNSATTYSYTLTVNLTQAQVDGLYVRITGAVSGAGTATRVVSSVINLDTTHNTITPNPTLAQSCGIDMVLVIDSSGSVNATELQQMKDAFEDFVSAFLPGTPTEIAVVDFDTDATVVTGFTNNTTTLNTAINTPTTGGLTNWEDAIRDARLLFPHRLDKQNLIVLASDGDPNTIGSNGGTSLVGEPAAVQAAITQANLAKSAGIRIETLGISNPDPDVSNLESISSADAVTTTDFMQLSDDLGDLAKQLCGGTINVHKIVDGDGDPNTTGDQTFQAGWMFNANVTSAGDSSTPPSGTTDGGGFVGFEINLGGDQTATVNIVETVQPGYGVILAECDAFDNGPLGTWNNGNAVNGIVLGPADIVICTFYNSLQKTFTVHKDFQPNAPGSVTVSLVCANGIEAPASAPASEATPASFTVTGYMGNPSCTATESTIPQGYESTGTCTADLNTGQCTIVNVQRTANINVLKDFTDNNPMDVTIMVTCSSGLVTATDPTASESNDANFTVTGFDVGATCQATESIPFGYTANQAGCATLNITHQGTVQCTIVNTPTQATFTVYKDVEPDNPLITVTITVTCTSGNVSPASAPASEGSPAVFTITVFGPGTTCSASEAAPPGYNGNTAPCQNVSITNGNNSSCTITNTAIQIPFTVEKDFQPDAAGSVNVSLSCATGTVSPSSAMASEATPANFTVIAPVGDPNCTATESPIPMGYNSSGTCSAPLSAGTCTIVNVYNPILNTVPFYVYKDFYDNNSMDVLVSLVCSPGVVTSVDDPGASETDPANFSVENLPGTLCTASEAVPAGYTPDYSDCINVPLSDLSCTIFNNAENTSVGGEVEVPTLSDRPASTDGAGGSGLPAVALLALLPVLAAAYVAARKLHLIG